MDFVIIASVHHDGQGVEFGTVGDKVWVVLFTLATPVGNVAPCDRHGDVMGGRHLKCIVAHRIGCNRVVLAVVVGGTADGVAFINGIGEDHLA